MIRNQNLAALDANERLSLGVAATDAFANAYRADIQNMREQAKNELITMVKVDPDKWKVAAKQLRLHVGKPNVVKELRHSLPPIALQMAEIRYRLHRVDTIMSATPGTRKQLSDLVHDVAKFSKPFATDLRNCCRISP